MNNFSTQQQYIPTSSAASLFMLHLSCFLLVVCYVNMFRFWAWLNALLGPGLPVRMLPVLVTLLVLLVIIFLFARRINRGYTVHMVFLGLGLVAAFIALALPDPNIPIKRVHVAEYIILSFLVRHALGRRLQGWRLTLFTFLVTWLYGIHDEMLQGLHPLRFYGIRDIMVNGSAGLSGALLGHGLLAGRESPKAGEHEHFFSAPLAALFFLVAASVAWLVISLFRQPENPLALLSLLPLAFSCLIIAVLYPGTVFFSTRHHGLQALFWLSAGLLIYPLLAGVTGMQFA